MGQRARWATLCAVSAVLVLVVSASSASAQFSGTNGKIAFVRENCDYYCNSQIVLMAADGSGKTLVDNNGFNDQSPSWSPNGQMIAFSRSGQIYTMDSTGANQTATGEYGYDPTFSPDGTKIAFDDGYIYTMNTNGSAVTQITNSGYTDADPSWSPDGSTIAFDRCCASNGRSQIAKVAKTGGTVTLLDNNGYNDSDPDWSPNGSTLVFDRYNTNTYDPQIWTMSSTGANQTQLTSGDDYWPSYSPDGTKITFSRAYYQIYEMTSTGANQTNVTNDGYDDEQPSWGSNVANAPSAPSGLTATPTTSQVALSWANGGNTTGDIVRRTVSSSGCAATATDGTAVGGTTLRTSETDTSVSAGETYCYSVFATNGSQTSAPATVIVTVETPVVVSPPGAPVTSLQPAALNSATNPSVPTTTAWTASTASNLCSYDLQKSVNGTWSTVPLSPAKATSVQLNIPLDGNTYQFRTRADTCAADSSDWSYGIAFVPHGADETNAAYVKTWTVGSPSGAWGGHVKSTTVKGASATFNFTGRNIEWVGTKGPGYGSASIYIDGQLVKTVNANATKLATRASLYKTGLAVDGTHTIKIVNKATSGHPRIDIDGFVWFE